MVRDNNHRTVHPLSKNMVERRDSSINDWKKGGKYIDIYLPCKMNARVYDGTTSELRHQSVIILSKGCDRRIFRTKQYHGLHRQSIRKTCNAWGILSRRMENNDYASEYSETEAVFKNIEPGSIYAPVLEKGESDRLNYVVSHSYLKGSGSITMLKPSPKRLNSPLTERCRLCLGFMTGFPKAYREAILN